MRDLPVRLWPFIKFCLVGVVNTVVSYLVYLALHPFMPYMAAFGAGWVVGVGVSFLLNCYFTYHVRPTWRGLALFPLSSIPNIVLSSAGVLLMVEVFRWDERVAPLIATVLAVPISFAVARTILVGPMQRAEAAAASALGADGEHQADGEHHAASIHSAERR